MSLCVMMLSVKFFSHGSNDIAVTFFCSLLHTVFIYIQYFHHRNLVIGNRKDCVSVNNMQSLIITHLLFRNV
jgi:hypothetical protein